MIRQEDIEKMRHSKDFVKEIFDKSHKEFYNEMEYTLYKIARLPWYKSWRGPQIASKCLGIGVYWKHDGTPKSLLGYYFWTMISWFRFKWYSFRNKWL